MQSDNRKQPRRIIDLVQEIQEHPDYNNLNRGSRFIIDGYKNHHLLPRKKHEQASYNAWLRQVWSDLYLGTSTAYHGML
jgi:hypothetical protein